MREARDPFESDEPDGLKTTDRASCLPGAGEAPRERLSALRQRVMGDAGPSDSDLAPAPAPLVNR